MSIVKLSPEGLSLADKLAGGSVRLLDRSEVVAGKLANSERAVGWKDLSDGVGLCGRNWAVMRTVNHAADGSPLYDQVMIVEDPGSVVVCRSGDRVALTQAWRQVGERLQTADAAYVQSLQAEQGWSALMERLGCWKWECPRGIAVTDNTFDTSTMFARVAKQEALQEAGLTIEHARVCGRLNPNSTFFAHAQAVVVGEVVHVGSAEPEELEVIGTTRFFTPAELRQLVDMGELDDGLTLAALAIAGYHF